jgi:hypothetical protein
MRRLVGGLVSDIPRGLPRKRRLNVRAAALGVRSISLGNERRYALFGIVAAWQMGRAFDIGDKSNCRRERLPQERGPMISNVLSEAIEQIKRYQLKFDTLPTDTAGLSACARRDIVASIVGPFALWQSDKHDQVESRA